MPKYAKNYRGVVMDKSILETVHESVNDLYEIGLVDAIIMREFDSLCLQEVHEMRPQDIKEIRIREKVN